MCEWRLINVCNLQYHGLKNLVGNQRNVTKCGPCQTWLHKRVRHRVFKQLDTVNNWRYSVRRLRYDRHTQLVRFGAFAINNLHPKGEHRNRHSEDHSPSWTLACLFASIVSLWPDYSDNCQQFNYLPLWRIGQLPIPHGNDMPRIMDAPEQSGLSNWVVLNGRHHAVFQ